MSVLRHFGDARPIPADVAKKLKNLGSGAATSVCALALGTLLEALRVADCGLRQDSFLMVDILFYTLFSRFYIREFRFDIHFILCSISVVILCWSVLCHKPQKSKMLQSY